MKSSLFISILCGWMLFLPLSARETSPAKIKMLYNSLNPSSISEHLAFSQLYPHTKEGKLALEDAWKLLNKTGYRSTVRFSELPNIQTAFSSLVTMVNKEPNEETPLLSLTDLQLVDQLCAHLGNRKLKGYKASSERQVMGLKPEEIDLARGLFLSQLGDSPSTINQINSYEAMIDLMALQILTQLPQKATPEQMIKAINQFVFIEMGFRFPPHSLYAKDIDIYTFLPSVLDSRKGVCLGVSILYLCLAQRLELPLEMITPPGHIYIRYHEGDKIINIETTARGIHIDNEEYLSIDTCKLQQRHLGEVIGFAHVNQASVFLQEKKYEKSLNCYLKALPYLPHDSLLKELLGFNYIFIGEMEKGQKLLLEIKDDIPDFSITKDSMVEDYLAGKVDAHGIQAIFMHVDEKRDSILKKKEALCTCLKNYPEFRAGIFALATTWLQLHREGEALEILEQCHEIDPSDPTTNYYLSTLYAERMHYNKAWEHLRVAEKIVHARDHYPTALKELRRELAFLSPE
ncbi:MAG: hypothetical protein BGO14_02620 [Chlamydiales bacterium 38-26]|mgnify:CR=1 FL=1|nr:hypothetical protein [Chlamydiales bacterium]OJV09245.1 MAG: hypothetical protein BGO14_02620 [Chlamydiales bacterium 38-26]